jgi:hypothetical protein
LELVLNFGSFPLAILFLPGRTPKGHPPPRACGPQAACPVLEIRHVFAIVLEDRGTGLKLLEKMGFEGWGYLPGVADFDGKEVGYLYHGRQWNKQGSLSIVKLFSGRDNFVS